MLEHMIRRLALQGGCEIVPRVLVLVVGEALCWEDALPFCSKPESQGNMGEAIFACQARGSTTSYCMQ